MANGFTYKRSEHELKTIKDQDPTQINGIKRNENPNYFNNSLGIESNEISKTLEGIL